MFVRSFSSYWLRQIRGEFLAATDEFLFVVVRLALFFLRELFVSVGLAPFLFVMFESACFLSIFLILFALWWSIRSSPEAIYCW